MKEKLDKWKDSLVSFWGERSKGQKNIIVGSSILVILLIVVLIAIFSFSGPRYVPLYSDLSVQEVGQIKAELDARGVSYEIQSGGTTIAVPEKQVDILLVELAEQGIPDSGSIDYSFFSENSSFGITDNEFNIMKLDAMQSELANLITSVEGIEKAQVMITLPEESIFIADDVGVPTAAIVIETAAGHQMEEGQIKALYHLVSNAVPNLNEENIWIMNQYYEYFDLDSATAYNPQSSHNYQQSVKKDVERDIQRRLQQMLATMVGADNVIVSVTADIDFTQENRVEELVEPVDIENMEGLPVSLETIQETYSGNAAEGGIPGAGEEDVTNYPAAVDGGDGDYELDKETINYEFNRIRREIVESPYKIRDLGIQVAVDNARSPVEGEDEIIYLTGAEQAAVEQGIFSILNSIISTSVDTSYGEINPEENVSIVFQEFTGTPTTVTTEESGGIPIWVYIVGGILLLLLILFLLRRRKVEEEEVFEEEMIEQFEAETEIPNLVHEESEEIIRRKQLEKIAKEKPEEFAKLLRSWMGED